MDRKTERHLKSSIRQWWAAKPMTYAADHGSTTYLDTDGTQRAIDFGSREFFDEADAVFYKWNAPLHTDQGKFARLFDYGRYKEERVLEVGCGMGCMAMNWARQGASVTAVDLNPVAAAMTRRRFELYGLPGGVLEADGERLPFAENAFDFVYSWGVLHHTPGIKRAIADLYRVLRPGGSAGVMLYNRRSMLYRYAVEYLEGYLHMERDFLSPLELASRYGDDSSAEGNPHTWPVTKEEVRTHLFDKFERVQIEVLGTDVGPVLDQMLPVLGSRLLPAPLVGALGRRWGWSLWITGSKAV